jgi:hypothetical protein
MPSPVQIPPKEFGWTECPRCGMRENTRKRELVTCFGCSAQYTFNPAPPKPLPPVRAPFPALLATIIEMAFREVRNWPRAAAHFYSAPDQPAHATATGGVAFIRDSSGNLYQVTVEPIKP